MTITTSLRRIPKDMSINRNKIVEAVYDFFGAGMNALEKKMAKRISLYMLGRKKGIELEQEEKDAIWYVKQNLPYY